MTRDALLENPYKVYVAVHVYVDETGGVHPRQIIWEDGHLYEIDRVVDVRHAASLRAGGQGERYTCRILGRETYLFCEHGRWYVERRGRV